jgi:hypothetical protein
MVFAGVCTRINRSGKRESRSNEQRTAGNGFDSDLKDQTGSGIFSIRKK